VAGLEFVNGGAEFTTELFAIGALAAAQFAVSPAPTLSQDSSGTGSNSRCYHPCLTDIPLNVR
jgi:hypothetical protein